MPCDEAPGDATPCVARQSEPRISELMELLSEAAVEIGNLDDPSNPVAKRIRDVMRKVATGP